MKIDTFPMKVNTYVMKVDTLFMKVNTQSSVFDLNIKALNVQ